MNWFSFITAAVLTVWVGVLAYIYSAPFHFLLFVLVLYGMWINSDDRRFPWQR